jgi:hypothetical protein
MCAPFSSSQVAHTDDNKGAALVIVLAFVVLLTTLIVAYFSRTTTDRQLAKSSSGKVAADILARSALEILVADFKEEIAEGGTPPSSSLNIVPRRSGNAPDIPNLIRRSLRSETKMGTAAPSHASAVNSADDATINGRTISRARWNRHYLIPRGAPPVGETIYTNPIASFTAPDWVYVTDTGPTEIAAPNPLVMGRYAFAVYDEGGLLDLNVAGFPSANSANATYLRTIGRKGVLAFADLTATGLSFSAIDNLIGWRNYSSGAPTGEYSLFAFTANPTQFIQHVLESAAPLGADKTHDFGVVNAPATYSAANPRTDQALVTRGELLELRRTLASDQDALQYIGTFSREINRPTWGTAGTVLAARFPLSRFDFFTGDPLVTTVAAGIRTHFGLVYVPAAPPVAAHWLYQGTAGGALLPSIPAISGTNQNPDLFPLLQYALPGATIAEILSIGASLIDQCDGDDDTTWIEFAAVDPALPPRKAFGLDRNASTELDAPPRPANVLVLNRAFRNVGELGYGYRNASTSLDFQSVGSADAPLLDLFTFNTASPRSGVVSLNTQNPGVLSAILRGAVLNDVTAAGGSATYFTQTNALTAATNVIIDLINGTRTKPVLSRADVPQLVTAAGAAAGATKEQHEAVARSLAELGQTRTWGLLIDVVAQSGRYPPAITSAADLRKFAIEGEKRYWLHVAIDRFTGQVIDQQLEAVYE